MPKDWPKKLPHKMFMTFELDNICEAFINAMDLQDKINAFGHWGRDANTLIIKHAIPFLVDANTIEVTLIIDDANVIPTLHEKVDFDDIELIIKGE